MSVTEAERKIYSRICSSDGISTRDIAKDLNIDKTSVNRYLYLSPFMKHLCYSDKDHKWHGVIRQARPHTGIREFCGYYDTVGEFLKLSEGDWLDQLLEGCRNIGRNINDTRGLFHSFKDARLTLVQCFEDISDVDFDLWEIVFEFRIHRSKYIRIFADVLVITESKVFSLEFKMNDSYEPDEAAQAVKYSEFLEVIFGYDYDVIPVLVLTRASDMYRYYQIADTSAVLPVCSGDMLFNVFDEYIGCGYSL